MGAGVLVVIYLTLSLTPTLTLPAMTYSFLNAQYVPPNPTKNNPKVCTLVFGDRIFSSHQDHNLVYSISQLLTTSTYSYSLMCYDPIYAISSYNGFDFNPCIHRID